MSSAPSSSSAPVIPTSNYILLSRCIRELCNNEASRDVVMQRKLYETLATMLLQSDDRSVLEPVLQSWFLLGTNPIYSKQLKECKGTTSRIGKLVESEYTKVQQLANACLQQYHNHSNVASAENENTSSISSSQSQSSSRENSKVLSTIDPNIANNKLNSNASSIPSKSHPHKLTRIALKISGIEHKQHIDLIEKSLVKSSGVVSVTITGQYPAVDFIVYTNGEKDEILSDLIRTVNSLEGGNIFHTEETADKHANRFINRLSTINSNVNGADINATNSKSLLGSSHGGAVAAYRGIEESSVAARGIAARRDAILQQQQANRVTSVFKSVTSYFW
jgi:hypothetical protein